LKTLFSFFNRFSKIPKQKSCLGALKNKKELGFTN